MLKTYENTSDLVESDFKQIRELIIKKFNKEYTLDYIRKVCKGKRSNAIIKNMAEGYLKLKGEEIAKLEKLASRISQNEN